MIGASCKKVDEVKIGAIFWRRRESRERSQDRGRMEDLWYRSKGYPCIKLASIVVQTWGNVDFRVAMAVKCGLERDVDVGEAAPEPFQY